MNKSKKEVLLQLLGTKYIVLSILLWGSLIMSILGFTVAPVIRARTGEVSGFVGLMFLFVPILYVVFFVYIFKIFPTKMSVSTLVRTNKLDLTNEIINGDYNTDGKMCFSKHLMYDKKTHVIIAYDDILWVYKRSIYYFIEDTMFCTVDGRAFRSKIDNKTLTEFLDRRGDILVGFSNENQRVYRKMVKEFKKKK